MAATGRTRYSATVWQSTPVLQVSALLYLLAPPLALAAPASGDPRLRIEVGTHVSAITSLDVDRLERFVLTASLDKTLRLWDLHSLALRRVFRVPLAGGPEGRLYAAALSPDGRIAATGGRTGPAFGGGHRIHLFDTATGDAVGVLADLPGAVRHLAFGPEGKYLAVALVGGVREYDVESRSTSRILLQCRADGRWVTYDGQGRLAASTSDGVVRVYRERHATEWKWGSHMMPAGLGAPWRGSDLAVGFDGLDRVAILSSGPDRRRESPVRELRPAGDGRGDLRRVAVSPDGRYVFAAGEYRLGHRHPILRWSEDGASTELSGPTDTVSDLHALRGGGVVVASFDASLARYDEQGRRVARVVPRKADFRGLADGGFRASGDGSSIQVGLSFGGRRPAGWSLEEARLTLAPDRDLRLTTPRTEAPDLSVQRWRDYEAPILGGMRLPLEPSEVSRSRALGPDARRFVLGTDRYLRLFDRSGAQTWQALVPGPAWGVHIPEEARVVLAALDDGTVRWFGIEDGAPLLTLFVHPDGRRWVAWTPTGAYLASPEGESLFVWQQNRGTERAEELPASTHRGLFCRTDEVRAALGPPGRDPGGEEQPAAEHLGPSVEVVHPADGSTFSQEVLTVRYRLRAPPGGSSVEVEARADGQALLAELVHTPDRTDRTVDEHELSLTLPARDVSVSLVAKNRHATSPPATVRLRWSPTGPQRLPLLHVLAFGVSSYEDPLLRLSFADDDAIDIAAALKRQEGLVYRSVRDYVRVDAQATRKALVRGLAWLEHGMVRGDVAIVFLSGHGTNDDSGRYFFLPHDVRRGDLLATAVSGSKLAETLRVVAARGPVFLFVDSCHSGAVDVRRLVGEAQGVGVLTSAAPQQRSLELAAIENGAFTEALLATLEGRVEGQDPKEALTFNLLVHHVGRHVEHLTRGLQTPVPYQLAARLNEVLASPVPAGSGDATRPGRTPGPP